MERSKSVRVLGCVTTGSSIAIVAASAGFKTIVVENNQEASNRGFAPLGLSLLRALKKAK